MKNFWIEFLGFIAVCLLLYVVSILQTQSELVWVEVYQLTQPEPVLLETHKQTFWIVLLKSIACGIAIFLILRRTLKE